jgi:hypothetical protein
MKKKSVHTYFAENIERNNEQIARERNGNRFVLIGGVITINWVPENQAVNQKSALKF